MFLSIHRTIRTRRSWKVTYRGTGKKMKCTSARKMWLMRTAWLRTKLRVALTELLLNLMSTTLLLLRFVY